MKYKTLKKNGLRLLLGLIILAVLLKWIDISQNIDFIKRINPGYFMIGCLFSVLVVLFRAARFSYIMRALGCRLDRSRNLLAHAIVSLVGFLTPMRVGEVGKIFIIKKDKKDLGFGFIVEKLMDGMSLLVSVLIGIFIFQDYVFAYVNLVILVILGIALLGLLLIVLWNIEKVLNLMSRIFLKRRVFGKDWFKANLRKLSLFQLSVIMVQTFLVWLSIIMTAYLFALSLDIRIPFFILVGVNGISLAAALLSGIQIGLVQFSYVILLEAKLGLPRDIVGIYSLLNLFGTYLVYTIIGIPSYLILRIMDRKNDKN